MDHGWQDVARRDLIEAKGQAPSWSEDKQSEAKKGKVTPRRQCIRRFLGDSFAGRPGLAIIQFCVFTQGVFGRSLGRFLLFSILAVSHYICSALSLFPASLVFTSITALSVSGPMIRNRCFCGSPDLAASPQRATSPQGRSPRLCTSRTPLRDAGGNCPGRETPAAVAPGQDAM